jgi:dolichol kinase
VGRRVGKVKWCAAGGKTLEGSVAFVGSVLVSTIFLWAFGMVHNFNVCLLLLISPPERTPLTG